MSTTNILDLNNRIDELEKNSGGGGSADSAKRSDIATEFSTETSYTAGNFVYYEGKLYQFNADHSAGAWDPTDVVEANVTDQVVSNASAIAGLTASEVDYVNTTSGLTATDVQGALDEVVQTMGNVQMAKLWENPSPGADFAGQNVQIAGLTDYDIYMIFLSEGCITMAKGGSGRYTFPGTSGGVAYLWYRYAIDDSVTYGNTLRFSDSGRFKMSDGTSSTDNSSAIPLTVYGIKLT